MTVSATITVLGAASQLAVGTLVLWRAPRHPAHVSFGLGMLFLAAEALVGLGPGSGRPSGWTTAGFAMAALVPSPWIAFSLSYGRGDYAKTLRRFWPLIALATAVPVAVALGLNDRLTAPLPAGAPAIRLGQAGFVLAIYGVVAGIFVLTNLERTFRDSVGVMRWRIKYLMLGLGVLFAFRLYLGSQAVLYAESNPAMLPAAAAAGLLSSALIAVSLRRERIFTVDVYPSHALLFQSATVIVAGAYLIIVGLLAQLVGSFGGKTALPIQAFVILLALVALAIGLLSERFRRRIHLFVTRHLRRPTHDYRQVWLTFSARTGAKVDETGYCDTVAKWLAETFRMLSVNVWLLDEGRERFRLAGSTALTDADFRRLDAVERDWKALVDALASRPAPIDLETCRESWAVPLREISPGFFPDGGQRLCLPLTSGGQLVGLVLAGDRVSGVPFSAEDLDLLQCVGDQIAAGLRNLGLSRQLLRAKELEAFQTMSAFFVHDLKNTASTLSLLLQNLQQHFGNPAFREDALRAVGKSVQHLEHLIGRLGQLRQEPGVRPAPGNLADLARRVIQSAGSQPGIALQADLPAECWARFDAEPMGKVILNLLLNARDAVGAAGEVRIAVVPTPEWAELTVTDNGCGMTTEFVRNSLFRPFQTTKKRGIGIGMFQSKLIVDAHGGRVLVDSQPGKGTAFRVLIPSAPAPQ